MRDNTTLETSVAQVFNQRGDGVIVRGAPATVSRHDRQPHLGAWIRRLPARAFVIEYSVLLRQYMSMIVVDDREILWEAMERKLAERPDDFKRTG
ncbi:hypothetical protein OHA72_12265 [Dactylosporangium sp. NBC_01737]|uniref:hypothetical protein n=1 Tax=Dactylosporangium sp. NBC_01737 TaxID=2975959 RepID=UPI002E161C36|nr:hypothetical protein OHA72_12265 [Dactylosporangium sp. NBC_01737]